MNGITPGPLWLAIASSVSSAQTENRTLIRHSKNDTVTGEMAENQEDITGGGRNCSADGDVKPRRKQ